MGRDRSIPPRRCSRSLPRGTYLHSQWPLVHCASGKRGTTLPIYSWRLVIVPLRMRRARAKFGRCATSSACMRSGTLAASEQSEPSSCASVPLCCETNINCRREAGSSLNAGLTVRTNAERVKISYASECDVRPNTERSFLKLNNIKCRRPAKIRCASTTSNHSCLAAPADSGQLPDGS